MNLICSIRLLRYIRCYLKYLAGRTLDTLCGKSYGTVGEQVILYQNKINYLVLNHAAISVSQSLPAEE